MTPLARPADASALTASRKLLPSGIVPPTWACMFSRENWRWFIDHPVTEWSIFAIGVVLILGYYLWR